MNTTNTDERIIELRERAWELIRDGFVVRGLNALDRVNRVALKHYAGRRRGGRS